MFGFLVRKPEIPKITNPIKAIQDIVDVVTVITTRSGRDVTQWTTIDMMDFIKTMESIGKESTK